MATAITILALLGAAASATWIFFRCRDARLSQQSQETPPDHPYRAEAPGAPRPPRNSLASAPARGGAQRSKRTASLSQRLRATQASQPFSGGDPKQSQEGMPPFGGIDPPAPSHHSSHHTSTSVCAEVPLASHDTHHSSSALDHGHCSTTDWSGGGGFDGGGHHH